MGKILVLYAHPSPLKSRANRTIVEHIRGLPEVTIHDLYESYPNFFIDIAHEKKMLLQHDVICFQHPMYWYNMPALMKQWLDDVLEMGFAYGENGDALKGKRFLLSITTGGDPRSYDADGPHGFPIESFLHSYQATAALCGMKWMEPVILHSARNFEHHEIVRHAEIVRSKLMEICQEKS
jgi:glutathione-regulated potassium-efflux system ancillary protein KefG